MSRPHAPAVRLVSLCPSITETLIDFGRADALVGITRFCIHPAEVVATVRKVGGTKDPDIEAIAALEPDLVFVNEEENRKEDFDALTAHGLTVDATMTRTVDEVPDQLRHFGRLVRAEGQAEARAVELEAGLEASLLALLEEIHGVDGPDAEDGARDRDAWLAWYAARAAAQGR